MSSSHGRGYLHSPSRPNSLQIGLVLTMTCSGIFFTHTFVYSFIYFINFFLKSAIDKSLGPS